MTPVATSLLFFYFSKRYKYVFSFGSPQLFTVHTIGDFSQFPVGIGIQKCTMEQSTSLFAQLKLFAVFCISSLSLTYCFYCSSKWYMYLVLLYPCLYAKFKKSIVKMWLGGTPDVVVGTSTSFLQKRSLISVVVSCSCE